MKKGIYKYIFWGLPFFVGSIMFSLGIYSIVSSLLFFLGGYVFIKNIFDYRRINKNKSLIIDKHVDIVNRNKVYRSCDDIPMLKRTRIHHKVRKRIK